MVFVMVDSCRAQLERLTQRFVSAFPGSTIYQHTDLCRVPHDVFNNRVDAVFLETEVDKIKTTIRNLRANIFRPHYPNSLLFNAFHGFQEEEACV